MISNIKSMLQRQLTTIVLLCSVAPFFLNDFFLIHYQSNFWAVLAVDYGTRIGVLFILFWALKRNCFQYASVGLVAIGKMEFFFGVVILSAIGLTIDRSITSYLHPLITSPIYFKFPPYPNIETKIFDLTTGIPLIGLSEEIVFRGLFLNWLINMGMTQTKSVFIQSLFFGFAHWSRGPVSILVSFIWGIVPAIFILKYRSIYPAIFAHIVTDLVAFF